MHESIYKTIIVRAVHKDTNLDNFHYFKIMHLRSFDFVLW